VEDKIAETTERIVRPVPVPPATDPIWQEQPVTATEGERAVEVVTAPRAVGTGITVKGEQFALEVVARDAAGIGVELDEQARLVLRAGGTVRVEGSGYAPFTPVVIWMFSDPVKIGEVVTDAEGAFVAELRVPNGLEAGLHLIQINGVTTEGELRSISFPAVLTERSPTEEDPNDAGVPVLVDPEDLDTVGGVGVGGGAGWLGLTAGLLVMLSVVGLGASWVTIRRRAS
jgi:hypothetical protein